MGNENSNPTKGKKGELHIEEETKITSHLFQSI